MRFLTTALCVAFLALTAFAPTRFVRASPDEPPTTSASPQAEPAASRPATSYDFAPVDAKIDTFLKNTKLPGGGLLIIKDGVVIHEKYFGNYTAKTVVPIASASKWLSGAALMSVVDHDKLKLDDPVSKYIPGFGGDKANITVRMLFNHTHGLPADDDEAIRMGRGTLQDAAARVAKLKPVHPAGREFHYGSVGMQVGGRVAEVASGKSWRELFAERIAGPLHMDSTQFGALGFSRNPQIAGGARSSLRDYGNFAQMVLNEGEFEGRRILSREAARELIADHTGAAAPNKTLLGRVARAKGYAVGCWVDEKNANGETSVASSAGKFGFRPWIDRERKVVGVFMIEDRAGIRREIAGGFDVVAEVNRVIDAAPTRHPR